MNSFRVPPIVGERIRAYCAVMEPPWSEEKWVSMCLIEHTRDNPLRNPDPEPFSRLFWGEETVSKRSILVALAVIAAMFPAGKVLPAPPTMAICYTWRSLFALPSGEDPMTAGDVNLIKGVRHAMRQPRYTALQLFVANLVTTAITLGVLWAMGFVGK